MPTVNEMGLNIFLDDQLPVVAAVVGKYCQLDIGVLRHGVFVSTVARCGCPIGAAGAWGSVLAYIGKDRVKLDSVNYKICDVVQKSVFLGNRGKRITCT